VAGNWRLPAATPTQALTAAGTDAPAPEALGLTDTDLALLAGAGANHRDPPSRPF
jgi:hypothetical protein